MGLSASQPFESSTSQVLVNMLDLPPDKLENTFGYLDFQDIISAGALYFQWTGKVKCMPLLKYQPDLGECDTSSTKSLLRAYLKAYSRRTAGSVAKELVRMYEDIRGIDLSNLSDIDIDIIKELMEAYPRLESLSLCVNPRDIQQYIDLSGTCKYLYRLVLSGETVNTDQLTDLKPIADGCPFLMHLDIKRTVCDGENVAYFLRRKMYRLTVFLCRTAGFLQQAFIPLHMCAYLQHIFLDFSLSRYHPRSALEVIISSQELYILGLRSCNGVSPEELTKFFTDRFFPNLVELDLSLYKEIDEPLAVAIRNRFPKMRKLRLNECFDCRVAGLKELLKLENLVHVELAKAYFSDTWFQQLLECKKLKYLDLRFCSDMQDVHASKLVNNFKLEYLNLSSCVCLTNKFLKDVPLCTTLKELYVHDCNFSKECLMRLKQLMDNKFNLHV